MPVSRPSATAAPQDGQALMVRSSSLPHDVHVNTVALPPDFLPRASRPLNRGGIDSGHDLAGSVSVTLL
jgi:hypothetical protein